MAPKNDRDDVASGEARRARVGEALEGVLADTYVLQFQTQSFHWNVRGPHFAPLHALFEAQYEALADAVDELAERLRALGRLAPSSLHDLVRRSRLPSEHGAPSATQMLASLLRAHEELAERAREAAALADELGDPVSSDLLVERASAHEKAAWMLRATLEG